MDYHVSPYSVYQDGKMITRYRVVVEDMDHGEFWNTYRACYVAVREARWGALDDEQILLATTKCDYGSWETHHLEVDGLTQEQTDLLTNEIDKVYRDHVKKAVKGDEVQS